MKEQMLQMEARLQMSEISVGCLDGPTSRPRRRDKGSLSSQSPCIYLDLCDLIWNQFLIQITQEPNLIPMWLPLKQDSV